MTTHVPPSYREIPPMTHQRRAPRYANLALGAWLFISAFLWPHTGAAFTNTWVVGLLIAACSLGALRTPMLRLGNTALSTWLILTTLLWSAGAATYWNNLIVGGLVLILSLMDGVTSSRAPVRRNRPGY